MTKLNQNGFAPILLILFILILSISAIGGYFYIKSKNLSSQSQNLSSYNVKNNVDKLKTLTSTICQLSLMYPSEWKGTLTENNVSGCTFSIQNLANNTNSFTLSNYTGNYDWQKDIVLPWTQKSSIPENLQEKPPIIKNETISGSEGFSVDNQDSVTSSTRIYFHKGKVIFSISYYYDIKDNPNAKQDFEQIVKSIQLTGQPQDYEKIFYADIVGNVAKDQRIKIDFKTLETALFMYKKDKKIYPPTIQTLKDEHYLGLDIPTSPYDHLPYTYITDGNTFTLSTKLGDGLLYQVSELKQ